MSTGSTAGSVDFPEDGFARLPKGEPVDVVLKPRQRVAVVLGDHRLQLVIDGGLVLIDACGQRRELNGGRSIVGRDRQCDVVIDSGFKNVSRKHLVIETEGQSIVRLTDISSLGTFVPCEHLAGNDARARA